MPRRHHKHALTCFQRHHSKKWGGLEWSYLQWILCLMDQMKPQGEWIYWTCSGCLCSANKTFNNHLMNNSEIPPHTPLFSFETGPSSWLPMKQSWLMECCGEVWLKNNLAPLTGHSFHIGGTTHLLLLGMDPFIMMVQGH